MSTHGDSNAIPVVTTAPAVVGDASDVGQAGPEEAIRRMYREGLATLAALHEGWNAALAEFRDVEADGGLRQAAA